MSEYINNREQQLQGLQDLILRLHDGASPASIKSELKELIGTATAGEVAFIEQALLERGLQVADIMGMCDVHHQVLDEVLVDDDASIPAGHPVDVMRRENQALSQLIARMQGLMQGLIDGSIPIGAVDGLHMALNDLADVDKHYSRKEQCFFAILERHGIDGPSKVMWGKDDDVRDLLKETIAKVRKAGKDGGDLRAALTDYGLPLLQQAQAMIDKEVRILLPMCLEFFTDEQWAEIHVDSPEYGWCLVEPAIGWQPAVPAAGPESVPISNEQGVNLGSGVLTVQELTAIFRHMPVDVTFVDAEDRVRYFSETPERVFARSRTIIGRKVQHCHPPSSVDIVERILNDFRSGAQNKAAFWIPFKDKFVHIQYFAVHDDDGQYMGCLEVTQDIAPLQALSGERRLLQYD